jgi:hypothetical protein
MRISFYEVEADALALLGVIKSTKSWKTLPLHYRMAHALSLNS